LGPFKLIEDKMCCSVLIICRGLIALDGSPARFVACLISVVQTCMTVLSLQCGLWRSAGPQNYLDGVIDDEPLDGEIVL